MNEPLDRLDVNNPANQQAEQKVNVALTVQEFNTVMAALQELPHRAVDALLRNLIAQAQAQIQPPSGPRN